MSILSNDGAKNKMAGVILLLGAVLCAAVFNVLSRGESVRFSPFERTYIMFFLGAVGFNVLAFLTYKSPSHMQVENCTHRNLLEITLSLYYLSFIRIPLRLLLCGQGAQM